MSEHTDVGKVNETTTYSQDFNNRKMQVKAQVDQFKQSMEHLKK